MAGRTIAFGDIHGCSRAFDTLIDAVAPGPDDCLVMLGDFIDRGPDSRGVLDRLLALESRCQLVLLLGNHEIMLERALENIVELSFWLSYGGQQTIDSYGGDLLAVPPEHFGLLRRCRSFYETATHAFVHANYRHDLPWESQPPATLFWTHLTQAVPPPHRSGKTVYVGHTPQRNGEVLDLGHLVCLDTFCCGGGWLTAMDVATQRCWQAHRDGRLRA